MNKVLIVKTTSLGDVIHTLPALTDARKAFPEIQFDWVVEAPFADIPKTHPAVNRVIPVSVRQWRKKLFAKETQAELNAYKESIRATHYDLVIDAQGLIKSALLAVIAKGKRVGLAWDSAREPLASIFYDKKVHVPKELHAIVRVRKLFAEALGYLYEKTTPNADISIQANPLVITKPYIMFMHGTTWHTKFWDVAHWQALAKLFVNQGYEIVLPWGNDKERGQANRIAAVVPDDSTVLSKTSLKDLIAIIGHAEGVIAVDTGLGHLAAACNIPAVSIYGPTNPNLTGTMGYNQLHLCANLSCHPCLRNTCKIDKTASVAPCMQQVTADRVYDALIQMIKKRERA